MREYGKKNKYKGKEYLLQVSCKKILAHIKGNPLHLHIANERKTSPQRGQALKAQGVLPGAPDLIVAHARGPYHGLAIELKVYGGRVSDHQKYVLDHFDREGWFTAVVWSLDGFEELRKEYWDLPRTELIVGGSEIPDLDFET